MKRGPSYTQMVRPLHELVRRFPGLSRDDHRLRIDEHTKGVCYRAQTPELTVRLLERSDIYKLNTLCVCLSGLLCRFKKPSLCFVIHPFNLKSLQPQIAKEAVPERIPGVTHNRKCLGFGHQSLHEGCAALSSAHSLVHTAAQWNFAQSLLVPRSIG